MVLCRECYRQDNLVLKKNVSYTDFPSVYLHAFRKFLENTAAKRPKGLKISTMRDSYRELFFRVLYHQVIYNALTDCFPIISITKLVSQEGRGLFKTIFPTSSFEFLDRKGEHRNLK